MRLIRPSPDSQKPGAALVSRPIEGPILVVISHYDGRPVDQLEDLLESLVETPAGWPYHIRVIVNRANHGVRIPDIEQALKLPVSATIISNGPKAVIASNEGAPIITRFPRDKITTDLHSVARLVTDGNMPAAPEPARRGWWSSLVSRTSSA